MAENLSQYQYKIISADKQGACIFIEPEKLTRLFVLQPDMNSAKNKDPLLQESHSIVIANYINDQIV
jgi:hypothetical protein